MPIRKQSPPTWTKIGTDMLTAAGTNNVDLANSVATTAAAVVTEQSRSFLDAASKQFRDFSKQVFRQNLSFGNESVTTASTTTITSSTVNNPSSAEGTSAAGYGEMAGVMGSGAGGSCNKVASITSSCAVASTSAIECNVDSLPTDVKQEIKENISPEHTINEETLHKIQKLHGSTTTSTASPPADCIYESDELSPKDAQSGVENNK
uniref:Uncharacterized protein n=2 Tax=Stomoxys calcitrans TaxID=35570 RepID=A0A1I8PI53_STOCA